jgi:hypothetical protein
MMGKRCCQWGNEIRVRRADLRGLHVGQRERVGEKMTGDLQIEALTPIKKTVSHKNAFYTNAPNHS